MFTYQNSFYNLIFSIFKGVKAGRNPWKATTLEWQTAEFPPGHGNFGEELPPVYRWAYEFSVPGVKEDYIPQNLHPDQVIREDDNPSSAPEIRAAE